MKKNMLGIPVLILVTVILVVMVSIFIPDKTQKEQENGDVNLYYISAEGYTLEQIPYQFSSKGNTLTMANEILEQLKKVPDNANVQPSIPQEIIWSDIYLEHTNLIIDFTAEYTMLDTVKEIFLRSSVVKSLIQIEEISTVEFKVTGTPLMTLGNQPVGMMNENYFIDGTEENWGVNQEEKIKLFFADKTGTKLVQKEVAITVVNNIPMEQLIIEELIQNEKYNSPIPKGTTVLKAVTKDQICYLDFSKEFLNPMENVSGEVTVYAIVNSLAERGGVSKVQFTVNGKPITSFRSNIDFTQPISRNLDLIQK